MHLLPEKSGHRVQIAAGVVPALLLLSQACEQSERSRTAAVVPTTRVGGECTVPSAAIGTSTGMGTVAPTSAVAWRLGHTGAQLRGYVLVVRGQSGWHHASVVSIGGGATQANGVAGWEWGTRTVAVSYDSLRNTAVVLGTAILLDSAPVVLVDRVDSVGGFPFVLKALCPASLNPGDPAALYRDDPTVRGFIDGAPVSSDSHAPGA